MEPLAAIEATSVAQYLKQARWGYALVNAAHILGIAMLVGALAPLSLRLIGFGWVGVPLALFERILRPTAALGLLLAVASGVLLFSSGAQDYAATGLFKLKMALVAVGVAHALLYIRGFDRLPRARQRLAGAVSALVWIATLICGRLLGFL